MSDVSASTPPSPTSPRGAAKHASDSRHHVPVPKGAIIAVGLLLLASVVLVAVSQATGFGQSSGITLEAKHRYALVFTDGEEGAIEVTAAEDGALVHRFVGDEIGFVRVALRALIFDRQTAGIRPDAPFHLISTEGGQAYLTDPETGEFVALGAFGGGNGQRFTPLIEAADAAGIALPAATITLKGDRPS